jgi:hypothetical protein
VERATSRYPRPAAAPWSAWRGGALEPQPPLFSVKRIRASREDLRRYVAELSGRTADSQFSRVECWRQDHRFGLFSLGRRKEAAVVALRQRARLEVTAPNAH